jgi:hypothetical protein
MLPKPATACYVNTTHTHAHVHTYTKTYVIEYCDLYETLSHMHVCKPRVHIVSQTQMFNKLVGKIVNETKLGGKKRTINVVDKTYIELNGQVVGTISTMLHDALD